VTRARADVGRRLRRAHERGSGEPVQLAFDPLFDPMIQRAEVMALGQLSLEAGSASDQAVRAGSAE
jgi:hypothetical protein